MDMTVGLPAKYPRCQYIMGVDLGQAHDPTAICVVERVTTRQGPPPNAREIKSFTVRHLERLPLGMAYPAQAAHVGELFGRLERQAQEEYRTDPPTLVIDQTGVGRPVFDIFVGAGLQPVGVTITAGDGTGARADGSADQWRVSKGHLVSRLQAMLHSGELKIVETLAEAGALVKELQDFRVQFTGAGNAVFNARQGAHDDLVLAVAIALWHGAKPAVGITVRRLAGF